MPQSRNELFGEISRLTGENIALEARYEQLQKDHNALLQVLKPLPLIELAQEGKQPADPPCPECGSRCWTSRIPRDHAIDFTCECGAHYTFLWGPLVDSLPKGWNNPPPLLCPSCKSHMVSAWDFTIYPPSYACGKCGHHFKADVTPPQ